MLNRQKMLVPGDVFISLVNEQLQQGKKVLILVKGNSMNPVWADRRDRVMLAPFDKADLKPGVVVLAQAETGRYFLHRIVKVEEDHIILMGDGNWKSTERVAACGVLAKVVAYIRNGKQVDCSGCAWMIYSKIWMNTRLIRRWLLAVWRSVNK